MKKKLVYVELYMDGLKNDCTAPGGCNSFSLDITGGRQWTSQSIV